jgi:hypothetical protein
MVNYNNGNRRNFGDRNNRQNDNSKNNSERNNSVKKVSFWKKFTRKFTMKNVIQYYIIAIVFGVLINQNLKVFWQNKELNYSLYDLFFINVGDIFSDMIIYIFPVIIFGILFNVIRKKIQHKHIGNFMTHGLKTKLLISALFSILIIGLYVNAFKSQPIMIWHMLYAALFSFFIILLMLSAFLGIFKELLPALDNDLDRRNFYGRGNSGHNFNHNKNRNFNRNNNSNGNNTNRENFNR